MDERSTIAVIIGLLTTVMWLFFAAPSWGWDLGEMNRRIDATNFVVNTNCSGTLVSASLRLVLTNHHCIAKFTKDDEVVLTQHTYEGFMRTRSTTSISHIVADDPSRDLALLQTRAEMDGRLPAPLLENDNDITRGERVFIVGNPYMFDGSVIVGIVSSVTRLLDMPDIGKRPMLQVSGGVIPGNSGGAIYNDRGKLIGVPTAYQGSNIIGFAIPVGVVKEFLRANCFASVFDETADDLTCRNKA